MISSQLELQDRISKCEKILSTNPGSQIFAALADAYRKRGDLDLAFQVCQKGLKTHPDYGSAHLVMAKINLDKGMYDWAEAEVVRSAQLTGNTQMVEALRAEIMIYKGEPEAALSQLQKLHRQDAQNTQVKELISVANRAIAERLKMSRSPVAAPQVSPAKPFSGGLGAPKSAPVQRRSLSTREVIEKLSSTPGVVGCVAQNAEGETIAEMWRLENSVEWIRTANESLACVSSAARQAGLGDVTSMFAEAGRLLLLVVDLFGMRFVVCGGPEANPSRFRAAVGHVLAEYEGAVRRGEFARIA